METDKDLQVVFQYHSSLRDGILGMDTAICLDLKDQTIVSVDRPTRVFSTWNTTFLIGEKAASRGII